VIVWLEDNHKNGPQNVSHDANGYGVGSGVGRGDNHGNGYGDGFGYGCGNNAAEGNDEMEHKN